MEFAVFIFCVATLLLMGSAFLAGYAMGEYDTKKASDGHPEVRQIN